MNLNLQTRHNVSSLENLLKQLNYRQSNSIYLTRLTLPNVPTYSKNNVINKIRKNTVSCFI